MDIFWKILAAVLTAAVPVLTGYLCDLIYRLAVEAKISAENERVDALVDEIDRAVRAAVTYVNQTFVDALKKESVFDSDAAETAFETAFRTTIETISHDAAGYIEETFGDLRNYLEVKIEEAVRDEKGAVQTVWTY